MYSETRPLDGLHAHLLAWQDDTHAAVDVQLLEHALRVAGARIMRTQLNAGDNRSRIRASGIRLLRSMDWAHGKPSGPRFDLTVHVGHVARSWFGLARRNLLLAQSSWPARKARRLRGIDGVLCPTPQLREDFAQLGCASANIGWTSHDCLQIAVPRERAFFHRASRATAAPTRRLLALWRQHPEWPRLSVLVDDAASVPQPPSAANIRYIGGGLDVAECVRMQNAHLFHICLSPAGGGSRDLGEALAVGAVTLSVLASAADAPRDDHGGILVPARAGVASMQRGTGVFDEAAMEMAIERVMAMGDSAMQTIGVHARAWFQRNRQRYVHDLARAVAELCVLDQPASRDRPAVVNASR